MLREMSSGATRRPSTAMIRSPSRRPISPAGALASTSATAAVVSTGMPIMKTAASSATAKTRFVAGPATMTATFFHVRWRQYASAPSPSWSSAIPRSAARRAGGESSARRTASSSGSTSSAAVLMSPSASSRFVRSNGAVSSGASCTARPKCASTSDGAGRCIPGIFT
jgi:hypothetical protein